MQRRSSAAGGQQTLRAFPPPLFPRARAARHAPLLPPITRLAPGAPSAPSAHAFPPAPTCARLPAARAAHGRSPQHPRPAPRAAGPRTRAHTRSTLIAAVYIDIKGRGGGGGARGLARAQRAPRPARLRPTSHTPTSRQGQVVGRRGTLLHAHAAHRANNLPQPYAGGAPTLYEPVQPPFDAPHCCISSHTRISTVTRRAVCHVIRTVAHRHALGVTARGL